MTPVPVTQAGAREHIVAPDPSDGAVAHASMRESPLGLGWTVGRCSSRRRSCLRATERDDDEVSQLGSLVQCDVRSANWVTSDTLPLTDVPRISSLRTRPVAGSRLSRSSSWSTVLPQAGVAAAVRAALTAEQ
jgi:hypothetical protein